MLDVHLSGLEFIEHGYAIIIFTVPNIKDRTDMGNRRQTPRGQPRETTWLRTVNKEREHLRFKLLGRDGLRASFSTRREKRYHYGAKHESKKHIKARIKKYAFYFFLKNQRLKELVFCGF